MLPIDKAPRWGSGLGRVKLSLRKVEENSGVTVVYAIVQMADVEIQRLIDQCFALWQRINSSLRFDDDMKVLETGDLKTQATL